MYAYNVSHALFCGQTIDSTVCSIITHALLCFIGFDYSPTPAKKTVTPSRYLY